MCLASGSYYSSVQGVFEIWKPPHMVFSRSHSTSKRCCYSRCFLDTWSKMDSIFWCKIRLWTNSKGSWSQLHTVDGKNNPSAPVDIVKSSHDLQGFTSFRKTCQVVGCHRQMFVSPSTVEFPKHMAENSQKNPQPTSRMRFSVSVFSTAFAPQVRQKKRRNNWQWIGLVQHQNLESKVWKAKSGEPRKKNLTTFHYTVCLIPYITG